MAEPLVEILSSSASDAENSESSDEEYSEAPEFGPERALSKPSANISSYFTIVDKQTGEPKRINADGSGAVLLFASVF